VDNRGTNYKSMMLRPLLYADLARLVPFLLGNGVGPKLMLEWFQLRRMVRKSSHMRCVNNIVQAYSVGKRYFYWDMSRQLWLNFDGTVRKGR
jgi:hypothetical protein